MRRLLTWTIVASLWVSHVVHGQDALVGTWQGNLAVSDETSILVQFIIDQEGDEYAARLNAPREPNLRDVPVSAIGFEEGRLTIAVDAVSGVYEGALRDGAIHGTWTQQGASFPLDLVPYAKPVLTREAMRQLVGSWQGKVRPRSLPDGLTLVMRFEMTPDDRLQAFLDVPDQALFGLVEEVGMTDDNKFSIRQAALNIEYVAEVNGDRLTGEFTQGRVGPLPLVLQRGGLQEEGLTLSSTLKESVRGPWHGQLRGLMTLVLRFEEAADGSMNVRLDSPDQGVYGLPVRDVSIDGNALSLSVPGIGATMQGAISPNSIAGKYTQSDQAIDLTLQRGEYLDHALELPEEIAARLIGKWEAIAGNTPLVFRFERGAQGRSFAFMDIPSAGLMRLPVTGVRMEGDTISFVARGIQADFKGKWATDEISGQWSTPQVQLPLVITRSEGI